MSFECRRLLHIVSNSHSVFFAFQAPIHCPDPLHHCCSAYNLSILGAQHSTILYPSCMKSCWVERLPNKCATSLVVMSVVMTGPACALRISAQFIRQYGLPGLGLMDIWAPWTEVMPQSRALKQSWSLQNSLSLRQRGPFYDHRGLPCSAHLMPLLDGL